MTTPDTTLGDATVAWLNALLDSADPDVIGVSHWWARATTALETAATAETYAAAVSTACRKLQVQVLSVEAARTLNDLEPIIAPRLGDWAQSVASDLPYLVALARVARTSRKKAKTT